MRDVVLAIDQGTTGTTVVAVDRNLRILGRETHEFRQIFPRPGWVEHDLQDIWSSTQSTLTRLLERINLAPQRIAAIGVTNQRETVGLWDRASGQPLANAIVWQCRRTTERCHALRSAGHETEISQKTGLLLDPYFSASKLEWLLDHVPQARARAERGELAAGTMDTFLLWRLTDGQVHATDVSNASRTLLFDIHTLRFDASLLSLFRVPATLLPDVRSSAEVYGTTKGVPGLPDGIPISGMAGDQQAALFGQACFQVGDAKCTYGTGAFILMNTGGQVRRSRHNLLSTIAWKIGPAGELVYALEGSVFCAGAAVQWLRDGLGLIAHARDIEKLAREVDNSGEVVFVPAFTGLGAPHWRPAARGLIAGITRDTRKAHLARATLEGIALQVYEVMEAMRQDVGTLGQMRVDGGAAANNLLLQMQADLLGQAVVRPPMLETTAAGAAFLAGLGVQLFQSTQAIAEAWQEECRFDPSPNRTHAQALIARWRGAITRT